MISKRLSFTIPIEPRSKIESRSFAMKITGQNGRQHWTTRQHKSSDQERYEAQIMSMLRDHVPEAPFDGPLLLGVSIFVPMPKYIRDSWKREPAEQGIILPCSKPDLSNYLKNIEDCMTKLGFWYDDAQIVGYTEHTCKRYSLRPRWEITVQEAWQPDTRKEYTERVYGITH